MAEYTLFHSTFDDGDLYPKATLNSEARTWLSLFDEFITKNPKLKENLSKGQLIVLKNNENNRTGLAVMRIVKGDISVEKVQ